MRKIFTLVVIALCNLTVCSQTIIGTITDTHNNEELIANGEEALEPYIFDYLLLCNKVCGASHYNMQMKIIVETEEEFNKWIKSQQTFAEFVQ